MAVYFVLISLSLGIAYFYDKLMIKNRKNNLFFGFILFLISWGIQALRYDVGTDYSGTYTHLYFQILNNYSKIRIDLGFYWIYKFIIFLNLDLQYFFVISSFLINFFVFKSIFENSKHVTLNIFIYFFGTLYFFSMTAIRQSLAMAIFYYSLKYAEKKDIKRYMVLNIIGTLCHNSAVVFLPMYFILNKEIKFKTRIILVISTFICAPFISIILYKVISLTKYAVYFVATDVEVNGKLNFSSITNIIVFGCYLYRYKVDVKCQNDSRYNIYMNIHFIGTISSVFLLYIPLVYRFLSLFKYSEIITVPYLISLKGEKKIKVLKLLIISMYIIYFIYSILYKNYNDCIPYKTIFDKL